MDILGGLLLSSYIIKNSNIKNTNLNNNISVKDKNYNNIYNMNNKKSSKNLINNIAKKRYDDSKNPEKTGIIPAFYNKKKKNKKVSFDISEDSVFSDDNNNIETFDNTTLNATNPMEFLEAGEKLINFNSFSQNNKNEFLEQFEDMKIDNIGEPVSYNNTPKIINNNRQNIEREMALNGGYSLFNNNDDMTYGVVNKENFTHDNMKPQFKSKTNMGLFQEKTYDLSQRKLQQFTGSADNIEYRPKTERVPLFNPTAGLSNLYGNPVMTDYFESREIPGLERRGELPFQQTRVTPGLGLAPNENSKQGFHDMTRILPKTVDELRPKNKPKLTYKKPIIEGMKGQRGPISSKVFKRRPNTFFETDPNDMQKTGRSDLSAPTIHAPVDPNNLATINRGVKGTEYIGPAKNQEANQARGHDSSYDPKITERGKENNYIGPAGVERTEKLYAYDKNNAIPDATKRSIHAETDRAGAGMGIQQLQQLYAYDKINNIQDPNMRNVHENFDRAGNAMGSNQLQQLYAYDKINNIQDPNMRNVHENFDRAGNAMGSNQLQQLYAYDKINNIQDPNMRNIHENFDRAGVAMGSNQLQQLYAYDKINNIQDPNMRNIHENNDRAGNAMGSNQLQQLYAYDKINNIQDPNMRNIHENNDRAGAGMGNSQIEQLYAYDKINNIQDATMRDIHSKYDRNGNALGNGQLEKAYVYDYVNNIQDPTMRNLYEKMDRAGNALGNSIYHKPQAFDKVNAIPDPTMRDIQVEKKQQNGLYAAWGDKQRNRGDFNNAQLNESKEVISRGRKPTDSNYTKGPIMDYTNFRMCEPIQINRELYPENKHVTTDRLPFYENKYKHNLPQQSWRFYDYTPEVLNNNPYINNVIHRAV
jgi:hypothetical protein